MNSPQYPRMFGKYALLRPFARGEVGEICLAALGELGGAEKLCLVKKVPEERDRPGLTARLLDEARVAVRLNHTNLVQVFDVGQVGDELYIAMEFIEGRDLHAICNRIAERRSHLPIDVALYLVREIARGLDCAHEYDGLHLVHRDIAPPNVLVSWHGEVKITGFGLSHSMRNNEAAAPRIVVEQLAYLAPEQARGEEPDRRADVYATGVILWELLTGRPLGGPEGPVQRIEWARQPKIELPSRLAGNIPSTLDGVVMRALAPERQDRYPTAEALRGALAEELARVAPTTDASRVGTFLRELFPDEIKREASEREQLLRKDLPKLRARRTFAVPLGPRPTPQPKAATHIAGARAVAPTSPVVPSPLPPGASSVRRPVTGGEDTASAAVPSRPVRSPSDVARRVSGPAAPARNLFEEEEERREGSEEPDNLVGELIDGRYRVERLLGTGGMGAVYEAEHIEIGKKVALKVLHPQFSRQADLVARFRREARAASRVGHPNIIDVTDSGTTEHDDVYFVMERLEGLDLGEVLRQEFRIAADRAVAICTQICRALAAAHSAGIIHRDLKPENIFLVARDGNADFVKVLDFGIAKSDVGQQHHAPRRLTTPGIAMGTPEYMAPEQAAGKAIDGRVDIYSVGAILYEMLTGQPPHAGANVMDILAKKATELPTPIYVQNPTVPEPLQQVVMSCLEREPEARPQTMAALEYELTKSLKGRGSAVAAVLGLKTPVSDDGWDESSKPRPFDFAQLSTRPSVPSLLVGDPAPLPTEANAENGGPSNARGLDALSSVGPRGIEARDLRLGRRDSRWGPLLSAAGGLLFLIGGGYLAYRHQLWRMRGSEPHTTIHLAGESPRPGTLPEPIPPPVKTAPPPEEAPRDPVDEEKMSEAEVDRLLEWARRAADGSRIVAPPGDNLKELLERIEKARPGHPGAEALRQRTAVALAKKGSLALKKSRVDEAESIFRNLYAIRPDDWSRLHWVHVLSLRADREVERKHYSAALADANQALELEPTARSARLALADSYLAIGRRETAAEEYQRILEKSPKDKRAHRGYLLATEKPKGPVKKKRR